MKSCVEFQRDFKYLAEIDEFNIQFKRKDRELINFLSQYAVNQQRVNIYINDFVDFYQHKDIELINAIIDQNPNFQITLVFDRSLLLSSEISNKLLSELKCDFYFQNVICDWDFLYGAAAAGVSDVFVGGQLGFELPEVVKFCREHKLQIRAKANLASAAWIDIPGLKTFFIRPEDVNYYDEYNLIDIIEFVGSKRANNVNYEVYFKKHKWSGPLKTLIEGYNGELDNYYILPKDFADARSKCRRRCLSHNNCHYCDSIEMIAQTLKDSKEYEVFNKKE